MKRIPSILIESLATILIGSGPLAMNLQAQNDLAVTVTIPFPFTVDRQSIAPGTYQFSLSPDQFLLSVINVKTGHRQMFDVYPVWQRTPEEHGYLIFRSSTGCSVLNEVHFSGTDTYSELIPRHHPERIEAMPSAAGNAMRVAQR